MRCCFCKPLLHLEMCNVLGKPQKEQLCQNLDVSTGQEAFEDAVVLERPESSFCLNGTVAPKQFSLFGGNILVRLLAHLLKFPADGNFFLLFSSFALIFSSCFRTCLSHTKVYLFALLSIFVPLAGVYAFYVGAYQHLE